MLHLVDKTSDRIKTILEESEAILKELKARIVRSEQPRLPPSESESEGEAEEEEATEEEVTEEEEATEEEATEEEASEEDEVAEEEEVSEEEEVAEEEVAEEEEVTDDAYAPYNYPVRFSIWNVICCSRR